MPLWMSVVIHPFLCWFRKLCSIFQIQKEHCMFECITLSFLGALVQHQCVLLILFVNHQNCHLLEVAEWEFKLLKIQDFICPWKKDECLSDIMWDIEVNSSRWNIWESIEDFNGQSRKKLAVKSSLPQSFTKDGLAFFVPLQRHL